MLCHGITSHEVLLFLTETSSGSIIDSAIPHTISLYFLLVATQLWSGIFWTPRILSRHQTRKIASSMATRLVSGSTSFEPFVQEDFGFIVLGRTRRRPTLTRPPRHSPRSVPTRRMLIGSAPGPDFGRRSPKGNTRTAIRWHQRPSAAFPSPHNKFQRHTNQLGGVEEWWTMMGLAHCLVPRPWCASTSNVQLSIPSGPIFSVHPAFPKARHCTQTPSLAAEFTGFPSTVRCAALLQHLTLYASPAVFNIPASLNDTSQPMIPKRVRGPPDLRFSDVLCIMAPQPGHFTPTPYTWV